MTMMSNTLPLWHRQSGRDFYDTGLELDGFRVLASLARGYWRAYRGCSGLIKYSSGPEEGFPVRACFQSTLVALLKREPGVKERAK